MEEFKGILEDKERKEELGRMLASDNNAEKVLASIYIALHIKLKYLAEITDMAGKSFLFANDDEKKIKGRIYENKRDCLLQALALVDLLEDELIKGGYGILDSDLGKRYEDTI